MNILTVQVYTFSVRNIYNLELLIYNLVCLLFTGKIGTKRMQE